MIRVGFISAFLLLVACGDVRPAEPVRAPPEDILVQPPVQPEPPQLSEAALNAVEDLREIAGIGTLRGLARRASLEEGFISNFADESHFAHWDLLRRTGVDPNTKLLDLLNEPHAVAGAGEEVWYVWPDLATLSPEELIPERLSFIDRARLQRLVGDEGVEAIRQGKGYPGFRTAISEDGRWLYFVHELEE